MNARMAPPYLSNALSFTGRNLRGRNRRAAEKSPRSKRSTLTHRSTETISRRIHRTSQSWRGGRDPMHASRKRFSDLRLSRNRWHTSCADNCPAPIPKIVDLLRAAGNSAALLQNCGVQSKGLHRKVRVVLNARNSSAPAVTRWSNSRICDYSNASRCSGATGGLDLIDHC